MSYKAQMIKDYIERNEKESQEPDKAYLESVEKMRDIKLASISKGQVEKIIKLYLYEWGRMQRVLGRKEFQNWEINVIEQIRQSHEMLDKFRKEKLSTIDIKKQKPAIKSEIEKCYNSFKSIIGKTAASKVLHLICPDFFPMWDTKIADAYRRERKNNNQQKPDSGADYYEFMLWVKDFMRENNDVLIERGGRTKVKVLDDFLWALANRPLMIFEETFSQNK